MPTSSLIPHNKFAWCNSKMPSMPWSTTLCRSWQTSWCDRNRSQIALNMIEFCLLFIFRLYLDYLYNYSRSFKEKTTNNFPPFFRSFPAPVSLYQEWHRSHWRVHSSKRWSPARAASPGPTTKPCFGESSETRGLTPRSASPKEQPGSMAMSIARSPAKWRGPNLPRHIESHLEPIKEILKTRILTARHF